MALLTSIYVTHSFKRSTALALRYVGMPVRKEVVLPLAGFPKPFLQEFLLSPKPEDFSLENQASPFRRKDFLFRIRTSKIPAEGRSTSF